MAEFVVNGGHPLSGSITPQGAKNEALQIIAASILTEESVRIENVPQIIDIENLLRVLECLGATVKWDRAEHTVEICSRGLDVARIGSPDYNELMMRLRGSVLLIGPLLARFGRAFLPKPGGDKIGRRRVDTHLHGLIALGAKVEYDRAQQGYTITMPHPKGCYILLDEASVTGTANLLMAGTRAEGATTLYNAACEPYIQQLCHLLVRMGARITGIGSNLLTIEGPVTLGRAQHRLLPDMIEVGSFIGLAAITRSEIAITGAGIPHLGPIPMHFRRLGIRLTLDEEKDTIVVPRSEGYRVETFMDGSFLSVADAPWPGLTPDLLSIILVVATQAEGSLLVHQKMFESRLFFVDSLIDMGAQILLCDPHRAMVIGHNHRIPLRGARLASPDIRAGMALLLAALAAEGESRIRGIEQIERGYEGIESRLQALGAHIQRVG